MRLLVTRPQPQAAAWVAQLAAAGLDARALPLLRIEPMPDASALTQAWQGVAGMALVVFVSPNAVTQFFAARPPAIGWPAGVLAASPGPGSDDALAAVGVPAVQRVRPPGDAAQFDSEALWPALQHHGPWTGRRVLIVRGDGGRDWLAQTLEGAGAQVSFVQAYRRAAPRWDAAERAVFDDARARPAAHLWLLSSGQALDHLPPGDDRSAWRALASHPRIAERARALGWGEVHETRPALVDVVAAARALGGR